MAAWRRKPRVRYTVLLMGVAALALAACSGSDDNDNNNVSNASGGGNQGGGGGGGSTPPSASDFGSGFATRFNADRNSEPSVPSDADVIPLSLTTEPTAVP